MADWWTKPSKISQGRKKVSEKLVEIHNQINKLFRQYLRANTIERFDELDIREEKVDDEFFLNIKNEIITNRLLYGIDITLHPTDFAKTSPSSPRLEKFGYTPITSDMSFTDIVNVTESNIKSKIDYSKTHKPIPAPPPPPTIPWEFIGISEETGYAGYEVYYNPSKDVFVTVDPDTKKPVKENSDLAIEVIASIDTEGHEGKTYAEIRVRGTTKGGLKNVEAKEKELETTLLDWINSNTAIYRQEIINGAIKNKSVKLGFSPKMMSHLMNEIDSRIKEGRRIIPTNTSEPVSGLFEYKNRNTKGMLWSDVL